MRTTIDLPDELFRRTKARAALQGVSMKELIVRALERETVEPAAKQQKPERLKLPHIRWTSEKKLDLTGFDFDELLG